MGQKVSPTGFRLGITEEWRSRWYADKDYAQNLANDLAIRKFLDKQLARAAVSKVEIERAGDKIKVIVTTARPGVVIGKKGAEIDALRKKLEKVADGPVSIDVVEVKRPELDAELIAQSVAENAADVGILNQGQYGDRVVQLPYRTDELVLVVPTGHALARRKSARLADALHYDFVGAHPGSAINNQLTRAASEAGLPLRLRMQVTSYDALCLMVAAGLGVGVMPRGSAALYKGSQPIRVVTLNEPWAHRQLVLCVRSEESLSSVARLLVDHLRAQPPNSTP